MLPFLICMPAHIFTVFIVRSEKIRIKYYVLLWLFLHTKITIMAKCVENQPKHCFVFGCVAPSALQILSSSRKGLLIISRIISDPLDRCASHSAQMCFINMWQCNRHILLSFNTQTHWVYFLYNIPEYSNSLFPRGLLHRSPSWVPLFYRLKTFVRARVDSIMMNTHKDLHMIWK